MEEKNKEIIFEENFAYRALEQEDKIFEGRKIIFE